MECKEAKAQAEANKELVLIETLWNVKSQDEDEQEDIWIVLIETLWNVKNNLSIRLYYRDGRINRNIVECKEWIKCRSATGFTGINRNIVECKDLKERRT